MNTLQPRIDALSDSKKKQVPIVAIVREVAPTKSVKEDAGPKGLGVGEFQQKYFGGRPVYWDKDQLFVKAMGSRTLKFKFKNPWYKPWAVWKEITQGMKAFKDKGVEGNLVGDGWTLGGVIVVGPGDQGVTHAFYDENEPGAGIPFDELVAAVEKFSF